MSSIPENAVHLLSGIGNEIPDHYISPICRECILFHTQVKKFPFNIRCNFIDQRTIDIKPLLEDLNNSGLSEEEKFEILCYISPSFFAHEIIRLKTLRPGQPELLHCTSLRQVLRWPRRVGKSASVSIKFLHVGTTRRNMGMMYICKHESQVNEFFQKLERLASRSEWVMARILKPERSKSLYVSSPVYQMKFVTGSFITGHILGKTASDGKGSATIRGLGISGFDDSEQAGIMFADEYDYLTEAQIKAFLPILTEGGGDTIAFIAASTPTGLRQDFYEICRGRRAKEYREDHKTVYDIYPKKKADRLIAEAPNEDYVTHELLAQFGQEMVGVFKEGDIQSAEWGNGWKSYPSIPLDDPDSTSIVSKKKPGVFRTMGVDWNSPSVGARIFVVEYDPSAKNRPLRVIHVERISAKVYSQTLAIKAIIAINRAYCGMDAIYVDYGAGSQQVELLHIHGDTAAGRLRAEGFRSTIATPFPVDKILSNVKAIDMSSRTEIFDPSDEDSRAKKNKPFMISLLSSVLEESMLFIPKLEYDLGLSGAAESLRMFRKVRISSSGDPVYSQDNDHDVIALALGIMGYFVECTNMPLGPRAAIMPTAAMQNRPVDVLIDPSGKVKAVSVPGYIHRKIMTPYPVKTREVIGDPSVISTEDMSQTEEIKSVGRKSKLGSFAAAARRSGNSSIDKPQDKPVPGWSLRYGKGKLGGF